MHENIVEVYDYCSRRNLVWYIWLSKLRDEKVGMHHTKHKTSTGEAVATETDSIVCCTDLLTGWFILWQQSRSCNEQLCFVLVP